MRSIFTSLKFFHVSSAGGDDFFHHSFASINSRYINKHIFFRSGHLGEEGDKWSILTHHVSVSTDLDEFHGVLGKFEEGSFTGNHLVKEVHGVSKNGKSEFMSVSLGNKFSSFGFSDGGDLSKGRSGVDDVFSDVSKINSSFVKRGRAGVVMFGSSFEGVITVFDFLSSENFFIFTVSLLNSPHSIMFSLFSSDLFVKFLDDSKD